MPEKDALRDAKFGNSLWLSDFPAKLRVLTRDPMVYVDKFANTRYAFVVFNLDTESVQILDKTAGFSQRFKDINADPDYGNDIRMIDVKVTTNGKQGKEIRYTINPLGEPKDLTEAQKKIISENRVNLEEIIKKKAPNALRLSEVNAGEKPGAVEEEDEPDQPDEPKDDVVIEDIGEPINLDDIPF